MKQGEIFLNQQERFCIDDGSYWTSGEYMELFSNNTWLVGNVEHDFNRGYYFTNGEEKIYLKQGMFARKK